MDWPTVAAFLTAGATILLASLAYFQFRENKRLIEASADQAKATENMLTEAQLSRELEHAPILLPSLRYIGTQDGKPVNPRGRVENIGRGVAVELLFCAREESDEDGGRQEFYFTMPNQPLGPFATLQPREAREEIVSLRWPADSGIAQSVLAGVRPDNRGACSAAVCIDALGTRYRFHWDITRPDRWKPGDPLQGWESWFSLPESDGS